MNWAYITGDGNMNVEKCIIGCAAYSFSYAGLQNGYAPTKAV
jgi:hypothetical protein